MHLQLFRERLSENVHATIPKGIVGGFEFLVSEKIERIGTKGGKPFGLSSLDKKQTISLFLNHTNNNVLIFGPLSGVLLSLFTQKYTINCLLTPENTGCFYIWTKEQ